VTVATGAGVTVTAELPLLPSLVAVMVAVPADTAVTSPVLDTVATAALSELHVTSLPVNTLPFAAKVVAVACAVSTAVMVLGVRATVTDATEAGFTVTVALPLFPSLVAVITAVPGATPVTTPLVRTVATEEFPDDHVIARPARTLPFASRVVPEACVVWPTSIVPDASDAVTDAIGTGVTVIAAAPILPSLVAVIVAAPTVTAVTRPVVDTVATVTLSDAHVTARPLTTLI